MPPQGLLVLAALMLVFLPCEVAFTHHPSWYPWYHACAVGEASHPGPAFNVAITNPTAIFSKVTHYQQLHKKHKLDLIVAAETSATKKAQAIFQAKIASTFRHVHWSMPVGDHFQRSDGAESVRGLASGVALLTHRSSRIAKETVDPQWSATSRILHVITRIGAVTAQFVVIYAVPTTHPGHREFNSQLLQEAFRATMMLNLPAAIMGDFNADPWLWEGSSMLSQAGYIDIKALHRRLRGTEMPPTCREATWPDNALCCPRFASWIRRISVDPSPVFDTHKVVTLNLEVTGGLEWSRHMPMPRSFLELPMNKETLPDYYAAAVLKEGEPTTLEEWGATVEKAIDWNVYNTSKTLPDQTPRGLPKTHRGRCQPRSMKHTDFQGCVRHGRPGDFAPSMEIHSYATLRKIKQVRRLQSLCRMLVLPPTPRRQATVLADWRATLRSQAFGTCFGAWALSWPEIAFIPVDYPTLDLANTLYQLTRYETERAAYADKQMWQRKLAYRAAMDHSVHGDQGAFKRLRDQTQPRLELHNHLTQEGIVVVDGTFAQVFLDNPQEFSKDCPCWIKDSPCPIIQTYQHHLLVRPEVELQTGEEITVTQDRVTFKEEEIMWELQAFWEQFWNKDTPPEARSVMTELLHHLPEQVDRATFYTRVAHHSGESAKCKGPAGIFKFYLGKLQWEFDNQGFMLVTGFIRIHVLRHSKQCIFRWIQRTWEHMVLPDHTQRRHLQGLQPIDSRATACLVAKHPVHHQKILINEIAGGFQTRHQQSCWDPTTSSQCEFCPAEDSRAHRFFDCPSTQTTRAKHQPLFEWLGEEGLPWCELPVILHHPHLEFLTTLSYTESDAAIPDSFMEQVQGLDLPHMPLKFYTDGSCQYPQHPLTRFASCAAVLDTTTSDSQRAQLAQQFRQDKTLPRSLVPCVIQSVPGDQGIHRAELLVIVRLCEAFHSTVIHSDSAVALKAANRCMAATDAYELADHEDFDLLLRLQQVIHRGHREFVKVKAHQEDDPTLSDLQLWTSMGNKAANDFAIWGCWNLNKPKVDLCKEINEEHLRHVQWLRDCYIYMLAAGTERAISRETARTRIPEDQAQEGTAPAGTVSDRIGTYHLTDIWEFPAVGPAFLQHCSTVCYNGFRHAAGQFVLSSTLINTSEFPLWSWHVLL
eukprot:Skav215149  [mRNA]  locus=scaffold2462:99819:104580:- [translate_table: standard]